MADSDREKIVWKRALERDVSLRGFDDPRGWLSQFALPPAPAGERKQPSRPALKEDIVGSFRAIAELAAHWAAFGPCNPEPSNPNSADARAMSRGAAAELEAMARAITWALDHIQDETETT